MTVLKDEIARTKLKPLNRNVEDLKNYIDVYDIDENRTDMNDMTLWVNSTREFIKRENKGLKNDIRNFLM